MPPGVVIRVLAVMQVLAAIQALAVKGVLPWDLTCLLMQGWLAWRCWLEWLLAGWGGRKVRENEVMTQINSNS